jgi:hypothetical protein
MTLRPRIGPSQTLACSVLALLLFADLIECQVEAAPASVDGALAAWRGVSPRLLADLVRDGAKTSARPPVEGETDRPRDRRIETLLDFAEVHGVRVQLQVMQAPGVDEARPLIDAKLTGSYKAIRGWLMDVSRTSSELLVTAVQFRRGATDGEARAEIVFGRSRE